MQIPKLYFNNSLIFFAVVVNLRSIAVNTAVNKPVASNSNSTHPLQQQVRPQRQPLQPHSR